MQSTAEVCTLLKDVCELWVNSGPETFVPIHDIVSCLGPQKCRLLPFLHSISGRDTTSFPYNTGKKAWLVESENTDVSALAAVGEETNDVTDDVISQARQLCLGGYSGEKDDFFPVQTSAFCVCTSFSTASLF